MKMILFSLYLIALFPLEGRAQSKILAIRKPVTATFNGQPISEELRPDTILKVGTTLEVGDKGIIVIKSIDGSVVKLGSGSTMTIPEVYAAEKPESKSTIYYLLKGAAFFFFPKDSSHRKLVKTKTASFGVRGTTFFVSHGNTQNENDIWMCVKEGVVEAEAEALKNRKVAVREGEGIRITEGKTISEPTPLPWTRKLNWSFNAKSGPIDNTVSIEEAYSSPLRFDFD